MRRAANPNLEIMEIAVARVGTLAEEMVFLGGRATGLLITDAGRRRYARQKMWM
ncbi:MAG: hypothetical protein WB870_07915 [Gallionellaceae bacterium]